MFHFFHISSGVKDGEKQWKPSPINLKCGRITWEKVVLLFFLMEIGGTLGVRPGISRNMTEIERTMHGKLQKKRGCFPRFSSGIWDGIYIYITNSSPATVEELILYTGNHPLNRWFYGTQTARMRGGYCIQPTILRRFSGKIIGIIWIHMEYYGDIPDQQN